MVKTITFEKYEETAVRSTLAVLQKWPRSGPSEICVGINGVMFTITGDPNAKSTEEYVNNMILQANALQEAFKK